MKTPAELYQSAQDGSYSCHCGGHSGLYEDAKTGEVENCPECFALRDYMRENKLGYWKDHKPFPATTIDDIPF